MIVVVGVSVAGAHHYLLKSYYTEDGDSKFVLGFRGRRIITVVVVVCVPYIYWLYWEVVHQS